MGKEKGNSFLFPLPTKVNLFSYFAESNAAGSW